MDGVETLENNALENDGDEVVSFLQMKKLLQKRLHANDGEIRHWIMTDQLPALKSYISHSKRELEPAELLAGMNLEATGYRRSDVESFEPANRLLHYRDILERWRGLASKKEIHNVLLGITKNDGKYAVRNKGFPVFDAQGLPFNFQVTEEQTSFEEAYFDLTMIEKEEALHFGEACHLPPPPAITEQDYQYLFNHSARTAFPLIQLCYLRVELSFPSSDASRLKMLHNHLELDAPVSESIPEDVSRVYWKCRKAFMDGKPSHLPVPPFGNGVYYIACNTFENLCETEKEPLPTLWAEARQRRLENEKRYESNHIFRINAEITKGEDVPDRYLSNPWWGLAEACCIVIGYDPAEGWRLDWREHIEAAAYRIHMPHEEPLRGELFLLEEIHDLYQYSFAAIESGDLPRLNRQEAAPPAWRIEPRKFLQWCHEQKDEDGNRLALRPQLLKIIGTISDLVPAESTTFEMVRISSCKNRHLSFDAVTEISANGQKIKRIVAIHPDVADMPVWSYWLAREHLRDRLNAKDAEIAYWFGGEGQDSHQGMYRLEDPKIHFICNELSVDLKSGYIAIDRPTGDEWRDAYYLPSQIQRFQPSFRFLSVEEIAKLLVPYGLSQEETIRLLRGKLVSFASNMKVYSSLGELIELPLRGELQNNINPNDYFYADDGIRGIVESLGITPRESAVAIAEQEEEKTEEERRATPKSRRGRPGVANQIFEVYNERLRNNTRFLVYRKEISYLMTWAGTQGITILESSLTKYLTQTLFNAGRPVERRR